MMSGDDGAWFPMDGEGRIRIRMISKCTYGSEVDRSKTGKCKVLLPLDEATCNTRSE